MDMLLGGNKKIGHKKKKKKNLENRECKENEGKKEKR